MYAQRIARVQEQLSPNQVLCVLHAEGRAEDAANIRYLAGYTGSAGVLLIRKDKVFFITDFRYFEAIRESIEKIAELICAEVPKRQHLDYLADLIPEGSELLLAEEKIFLATAKEIQTKVKVVLKGADDLLRDLRIRKDRAELETLREAQALSEKALEEAWSHLYRTLYREGKRVTERELALYIRRTIEDLGAEEGFPTIVASGPNSALPHHHSGDRAVSPGDVLLIDLGAKYQGYSGDMTRTILLPSPGGTSFEDEFKTVYRTVDRVFREALEKVRPHTPFLDLRLWANQEIEKEGYKMGHGLGHGIGLETHEPPFDKVLRQTLEPGMVVTIEPGAYLAGKFGIRLEDMIVVTKEGYENYNRLPMEMELPLN